MAAPLFIAGMVARMAGKQIAKKALKKGAQKATAYVKPSDAMAKTVAGMEAARKTRGGMSVAGGLTGASAGIYKAYQEKQKNRATQTLNKSKSKKIHRGNFQR
jgi:hypothetical protein